LRRKWVDTLCLVLEEVTKNFGGLTAVDHVSLEVREGERRGIIGPNGAGKTTLFNLICGELPLSHGKIVHFGKDVTQLPPHKRTALGIARTFQITNLFPNLTVLQNLLLAAQGLERTKYVMYSPISSYNHLYERSRELLEEVELWEKRDVLIKNLSHGEQRQIEVCLALIGQPRLLLLDEPTAGLSPAETLSFTSMLKKIDPGMTVLLIEHDMDVAFELAENITVLHQGGMIASGKKEDIKDNTKVQEIYLGME
jgi:branched-chain amino acid transport system ATP-binding protein